MTIKRGTDDIPITANTGINHDNVYASPGEIGIGRSNCPGSGCNILGRNLMRNIDDSDFSIDPQDDPFHYTDPGIFQTEIRQQCYCTHNL